MHGGLIASRLSLLGRPLHSLPNTLGHTHSLGYIWLQAPCWITCPSSTWDSSTARGSHSVRSYAGL